MIRAKIISFTAEGAKIGARIAQSMPELCAQQYARATDPSIKKTILKRMVQQAMADCDLIVFVGATGIAVRVCAPYLQGKQFDPAIIVVDDQGKFIISLLSGHLGGANQLTVQIAEALNAQPVITTATDNRGIFAVDTWAKQNACEILDITQIQWISGALLAGEQIGFVSAFPVTGQLPMGIDPKKRDALCGIQIALQTAQKPFLHTVQLIPKIVHIGIGCRKNIPESVIAQAIQNVLQRIEIPFSAIRQIASIDIKKDELGLCCFCQRHQIPFVVYSAAQLSEIESEVSSSAFVRRVTGVDNVCERAAILSSGHGKLLCKKTIENGVTVALATEDWRIHF